MPTKEQKIWGAGYHAGVEAGRGNGGCLGTCGSIIKGIIGLVILLFLCAVISQLMT